MILEVLPLEPIGQRGDKSPDRYWTKSHTNLALHPIAIMEFHTDFPPQLPEDDVAAIEGLRQGQSRVMAGIINNKIVYTPIHEAVKNSTQMDLDLYRISKILAI